MNPEIKKEAPEYIDPKPEPVIDIGKAKVFHGSNLNILPLLETNSIDAIVTDPPYELGFMGKKWDSSGIAYSVELWTECLRVLKPGGHLLAFSGSRTYHRMTVAIEDAGFEIRDMIAWISNKTFPKSLDISKAIDKGTGENKQRQLKFVNWMRTTGLKQQQINEIIGKSDVGSHYLRLDQPAIATADLFDKLRPYLPEVPEEIERLVAERTGIEWSAYKNREVIGQRDVPVGHAFAGEVYGGDSSTKTVNETAPATEEAKKWTGWGTALKPTVEPVVMARKPLIGTVAANVLEWGTGGLNIDGSRIGTEERTNQPAGSAGLLDRNSFPNGSEPHTVQGRWPANIILDEYTAGLLDEQEAEASRFFYVAKASKKDRNAGLDDLPDHEWRNDGAAIPQRNERPFLPSKNHHPTVKPTALMEYLIKLVTPPNGIVLDPFTGSGSTGKAALLNGFDFIGIELTEEYLPIIEGRLTHALATYEQQAIAEKEKESETLF